MENLLSVSGLSVSFRQSVISKWAICFIYRVLATYLSALHSCNAAVQSATLSSDSAMLRFFQNLFTQDLNTFNNERYTKKTPENGRRMCHLAPKI